jgi:uncharacterized membrane protein YgcG
MRWLRKGKDPKGTGVIVPQYDVLDGLTPAEVGVIMYQKSRTKDISAELIYLATQGYIQIKQVQKKVLLFNTTDYELTLLKDGDTAQQAFDQQLLKGIFGTAEIGKVVALSTLRNTFYRKVRAFMKSVARVMVENGYYKNLPATKKKSLRSIVIGFFVLLFGIIFIVAVLSSGSVDGTGILWMMLAVIVSICIILIFHNLMPAKTEKGVAAYEYLLGLKQYLQIAEKDRLQFHNAPEKKPEVFEKLLPYAMVFGVEKQWAKEFEDLYATPPSWYEGRYAGRFNALVFTNSLSHFNSYAISSMTGSQSGGSYGGGFSGGGGGGGGGGSW